LSRIGEILPIGEGLAKKLKRFCENVKNLRLSEWKQEEMNEAMCEQSLKTVFWNFEKSPWEHYISKYIYLYMFLNKFSYFQNCKYKIFMKISPCFNSPSICLKHSKKAMDKWFF